MLCIDIALEMTEEATETICFQVELPIVLITTMNFETFIKEHPMCKGIWTPKQAEKLEVSMELEDNLLQYFQWFVFKLLCKIYWKKV